MRKFDICCVLGLFLSCLWGCEVPSESVPVEPIEEAPVVVEIEESLGVSLERGSKADGHDLMFPVGFPKTQDLSILIPMDMEPPMTGDLPTESGEYFLSPQWLAQVSEAYLDTDVMDALERENIYEEWQVVSVRIATCGPLGGYPGELPVGVCWPQVRVVWQPVLKDFVLSWGIKVDRYGDDRAIHALYRVHPDASGLGLDPALEAVQAQIASDEGFGAATPQMMSDFYNARDRALLRLAQGVANMRGAEPLYGSWDELGVRAEYEEGPEPAFTFHQKLRGFMAQFAEPAALHELTSFSLPEGRSPASIDSWVFLAFDGEDGVITQRDIAVRSREDGRVLVNLGMDQTVSTAGEDPELEEAVAQDSSLLDELFGQVFMSLEDENIFADDIADPQVTFVQNTTCATCHRLTDLGFDFHTFSYFEDRSATISPRVVEDTKFDLQRMQGFVDKLNAPE